MSLRTVHEALNVLEEAIELGEQADVIEATAGIGAALGRTRSGAEVQELFSELVTTAAATTIDRGHCAVLVQRIRPHLPPPTSRGTAPSLAPVAATGGGVTGPQATQPPAPTSPGAPDPAVPVAPRWQVAADSVDVLRDFALEARALLDDAELAFLALESDSGGEGVATAFRAFHTIKGVAGFLELDVLAATAHRTESLLAEIRDGVLAAGPSVDVILRGVDIVRGLIDSAMRAEAYDLGTIARYYQALDVTGRVSDSTVAPELASVDDDGAARRHSSAPRSLTAAPRRASTGPRSATATPHPVGITPRALNVSPRSVTIAPHEVTITPPGSTLPPHDATIAPHGATIAPLLDGGHPPLSSAAPRTRRDSVGRARPTSASIHARRPLTVAPRLRQAAAPPAAAAVRRDDDAGMVKVDTHKMDGLVDLVGELAIAQAQLANDPTLATVTTPSLLRSISSLARVARELQRAALAMRMVAIKGTFDRMARVARDTARSLGKPITFVVEGAQTELDRTMVEAIYDPLVHLVRNAIDHGLEGAIERARRSKPSAGTLTLRAYHHAGQVVVEIVDDGGGLDRERILERARSRGVIAADAVLTPDEIHHLIFMPGFSTAAQVTAVSGRGVGMDVVKTNIERVRGRVEIDSTPGVGTTIRLKLPLTLAIIDGLLVGVGDQRYVLPATWAREIFRPRPEQVSTIQGRGQMVKVRGTLYPVVDLADALGIAGSDDGDGVLIMVDHGSRAVCLRVDRLLGKQEVVVKTLGSMVSGHGGVAGGAILGDGRIALILDIPTLLGPPSGAPERQVA